MHRLNIAGSRFQRLLWVPLLIAIGCFCYAISVSRHWAIVHDAAFMHYVVFLMDHGMAPYRDIIDINMPGAIMTEWLAMHVLGPGDISWRIFDVLTMLAAIGSCCVIAAPVDWRAGMFAGLCGSISHISNGAMEAGERDWVIAVLLLAGYAFLLLALRRKQAAWMAPFALACGAAASIKPLAAPIPFFLLAIAMWLLRHDVRARRPYFQWAMVGAGAATAIVFAFLAVHHATKALFSMALGLVHFYTGVGNMPYVGMAQLALGRYLLALLLCSIGLSVVMKTWRDPERQILFTGIVFGAALYFGQHKGWTQHKSTLMVMTLLFICVECAAALRNDGAPRWIAALGIVLLLYRTVALWIPAVRTGDYAGMTRDGIEEDLRSLGGSRLSGQVQCFEMVSGCLNALYDMRLVQSTGFISDFFLLPTAPDAGLDRLKTRWLNELNAAPPRVIVIVASEWGTPRPEYEPTENWPRFAAWLNAHYLLNRTRQLPGGLIDRESYRVYTRR